MPPPLNQYRRKRNFSSTPEPRGGRPRRGRELRYVIQKHAASRLHYDLRLEMQGVLKSWAIPKGPSLNPAVKRLAIEVEDHPLEYAEFEGVIPQGEYGGGTVLLWDRGTWSPQDDPLAGLKQGHLKFTLAGQKLRGRWVLVRRSDRQSATQRQWLLIKERDAYADAATEIVITQPRSVVSQLEIKEIAGTPIVQRGKRQGRGSGRSRTRNRLPKSRLRAEESPIFQRVRRNMGTDPGGDLSTSKSAKGARRRPRLNRRLLEAVRRQHLKRALPPKDAQVQLATLAAHPPLGDDWLHEIKLDGYRMLVQISDGQPRLISRNGRDWTGRFPELADAVRELPLRLGLLDGEVVMAAPDGTTSFQRLQNAFRAKRTAALQFFAFDLLNLEGYDTRPLPLEARKAFLQRLLPGHHTRIRFSEHVVGQGDAVFVAAAERHLEGIVSKRLGRPYVGGRGRDWLKVKCVSQDEFVIGGFTLPQRSRPHFGALLLGYYDPRRRLHYAGRVGTGFDRSLLAQLETELGPLVQRGSPFVDFKAGMPNTRGVRWVRPRLVAQVAYSNWTDEQRLRHPSFQGLREDKQAADVVRDMPISVAGNSHTRVRKRAGMVPLRNARPQTPVAEGNAWRELPADSQPISVAGVTLSHPHKVLYVESEITKLDLARYYEQIADWILPQVENRLVSLVRCPDGNRQACFFQKHPGRGGLEHLRRYRVVEKRKTEEHLAIVDLAGLISLVQMGVVEIHVWGSQIGRLEKPDRLVFDLDPDPTVAWSQVVIAAKELRQLLEQFELTSFVKTTGGKGVHVVVPVRPRVAWPEAKWFCRAVAETMANAAPDRYVATMSKAVRKGKVFVDYLRNQRGATAIAAYSTRKHPGAPVSVPVAWSELGRLTSAAEFTLENLPHRLKRKRTDPWGSMAGVKQQITQKMMTALRALRQGK